VIQNRLKKNNRLVSGTILLIALFLFRFYRNGILIDMVPIIYMFAYIIKDIVLGKFGFEFPGFVFKIYTYFILALT